MAMIRDIDEKDFAEIVASGTVLVDFWAPWCSYCKVIGAVLEQCAVSAPAEAVIAKVNVDDIEGAKDYCFTVEEVKETDLVGNEVVAAIMDNTSPKHANADCELNGDIVNVGGNDVKGFAIINQFMLICLQQNLCQSLVEVLKTKIKYDNNGVGKVMSAIDLEMKRYIKNGYISLNKYLYIYTI